MRRTVRRGMKVDLLPFLGLMLCVSGVQAAVLFFQSAALPLVKREAAVRQSQTMWEIYLVEVRRDSLTLGETGANLPLSPAAAPDAPTDWRSALRGHLREALDLRASAHDGAAAQATMVVEVAFDPQAIEDLRKVLAVLDQYRLETTPSGGIPGFDIKYRTLREDR